MRSYFFHLQFELCTSPCTSAKQEPALFRPGVGTNIFKDPLPQHSIVPWGESLDPGTLRRRRSSDPLRSTASEVNINVSSSQRSKLPLRLKPKTPQPATKDWRFDTLSVISINMERPGEERPRYGRGKSMSQEKPTEIIPGGVATKGKFVPSNPTSTEFGWGIVHLYRDAEETPGLYEDDSALAHKSKTMEVEFNVDGCSTLCILAVPSYMSPSDLLGYVGELTREDVSHFRLIRTGRANKYMVLMKFRDAKKAKEWQKEWNGKPFNTMEPEYCHVVFVQSINFKTSDQSEKPTSFPNMTNDPFLPAAQPTPVTVASTSTDVTKSSSMTTKPIAPPTPALVELPTCPVCLERMDESTGLLIILCQHVFPCACLEKWRGTGCPVCRYTQSNGLPGLTRGMLSTEDRHSSCSVCQSESNLWICLICGNLGCGRYDSAHAFAHWEETKHCYAMDIGTQHVWDYAGDGYVHRLIQNTADGKLMDLPAAKEGTKGFDSGISAIGADMVPREKMDAMGNEYTYLLTSQLDTQRLYYEEQLERAVDKASKAAASADKANVTIQTLMTKLDMLQKSHEEAMIQIKNLDKEVTRAKTRGEKSDGLARKLGNDWKEEKIVNDSLLERIKFLDARVSDEQQKREVLEAKKKDLEEQNRDLMFFMSSESKLKDAGEDIVQGTIEMPIVPESSSSGKKPRKKRK